MQATYFLHGTVKPMPEHGRVTDDDIISGFKSLLDAMELGFAKVHARIDALAIENRTALASFEQRMLRRFDAVDERFSAIEKRLDRMDARFAANEACMSDIRQSVSLIDGRLTMLEARA